MLSLLIPFILIVGSITLISQFTAFYAYEFEKLGVLEKIGIETTPKEVSEMMVNYIKGKSDEFQMTAKVEGEMKELFNEKEQLHMVDVRNLIGLGNVVCLMGAILIILAYVLLIRYKQKNALRKAYQLSIGVYIMLLVGMVIMSLSDFNKGFNLFHEVLFTNDLWLLNPNKDILLMMMPLQFFIDAFILALILSTTVMMILGGMTWRITQKRNMF